MSHQQLWAPWRMAYIEQLVEDGGAPPPPVPAGCFLCEAAVSSSSDDAAQRLVLHADEHGVLLLNRYPYTNGHLLIAPREHVPDLVDLTPAARAGLMELTVIAQRTLRAAMNPQGMNIGVNLGRCAGAGLPGHVHIHVVPRWNGDTNFMQIVGQVRVIPQALQASYEALRRAMEEVHTHGDHPQRKKS
jgi:ATP adenylyltransferase